MINLRKEAKKNRPCMVQIFGVCNHDTATTVLAHLNVPGLNVKADDKHGCWACYNCHAWLDREYRHTHSKDERDLEHLWAIIRTQRVLIDEGKL